MQKKLLGTVLAIAGLSLTGCGELSKEAVAPTTQPVSTPTSIADLGLVKTDLGSIVADSTGRTLYMFTKDTGGISTCYDACATTWPPALAADTDIAAQGIDRSLLGVTARKDGASQLTLKGMPLYRFAADTKTGDTLGQGNKGVWFTLSSDGSIVKAAAATTQTTTEPAVTTPPVSAPAKTYEYKY